MNIAVVGTGYVGLVTGTCFAETGNHVICVDIDAAKVERMRNGEVPIFEPGLDLLFERNSKQGRLEFTTDLARAVAHAQVIFLALPTPPGGDGSADLSYILGVAKENGQLGTNPIYEQAAPLAAQTDYEPYKAINYGTLKVAQGIRREAALRPAWLNEMDRAVVSGVYARYGVTVAEPTVEQAKQAADWIKTTEKRKPS